MEWLPGSIVIVYLLVKLLGRFPLLRRWTLWVGGACALSTLNHLAWSTTEGGTAPLVAALVSACWAFVFLREALRVD
jgi:hypothetical protein